MAFPIGSPGKLAPVPQNLNGWAKINAKLVKTFGGN
jgi:hypothetical protein